MTDQAENQTVKQAAQEAAQQAAEQTAQQIGEAVSQAIQKMMSTTGVSTTESRLEDIGGGERLTKENADNSQILFSNQKRTYDEYQDVSLESIKRNRSIVDKITSDAQSHDNNVRNVSLQALQNAVETANLVGKQAVAHRDIAIDKEWNLDEQGYQSMETLKALGVDSSTVRSVVAQVLADMTKDK